MTADTLVVSAHLDDAVLSCGHFLLTQRQSVVATVFAGHPGPGILSEWDRECGFGAGDDPVGTRRREDRAALAVLDALPLQLPFLDSPYRAGLPADAGGVIGAGEIAGRLAEVIRELSPTKLVIPLGLLHSDHVLTHDAGALLLNSSVAVEVWAYKDLPYGEAYPGLVSAQLDALQRRGIVATEVSTASPQHADAKRDAVACYASQCDAVMNSLGREPWERSFMVGSEQYWQLTPA